MPSLMVDLSGGMGDKLFRIAAGYTHAKDTGCTDLIFSDRTSDPIWDHYFQWNKDGLPWRRVVCDECDFIPIEFDCKTNNYTDELRKILQIHPKFLMRAYSILSLDGIKDPDGWIVAHCIKDLGASYYKKSRSEIGKRIRPRTVCWLIDDISWAYTNVYEQGDVIIQHNGNEFAILSLFRHVIMGSYDPWWATWLNPCGYDSKTRVICYPSHFPESRVESEWLRIETTSGYAAAHVSNQA